MSKTAAKTQTDFDEEELEAATRPAVSAETPTAEDGVPYCAKHHCRMKQTSGGPKGSLVAYYKCPVDGCEEKGKRVKAKASLIPAEPLKCHRCASLSPEPVMERDERASSPMYTVLKCPVCGPKSGPMPRPEFAARHDEARKKMPVEELGAR